MQGMISVMILLIFVPVVFAIYILYKRMHEAPKDNKSREILLQAMCLEEIRKKKGEDTSSADNGISDTVTDAQTDHAGQKEEVPDIDDDTKKAMRIANETLHSGDNQRNLKEQEKDSQKQQAADMVLKMMTNRGKNGASREELQEMINILSDKNK